jgi:uncharacterized protein (DUF362 family)
MTVKTDRRTFIKGSLTFGAAALMGADRLTGLLAGEAVAAPDLAVVKGTDDLANARRAVDLVGGMSKFVAKGGRVGLLVNAPQWWKLPGSHVHTDIILAVVRMCREAGARDITWLFEPSSEIWERSPQSAKFADDIKSLKPFSKNYVDRDVKGATLKKARVIKELFECETYINISIAKDHAGTRFSGCLKNAMGALTDPTLRFFHFGSGKNKGDYDDVDFLSQCIADVNLLRKPDLCLADATSVLAANGPAGPGELARPQQIVAGRDVVAVDTFGAGLLGRDPRDIVMLKKAADLGLGTTDLGRLNIKKVGA